MTLSTEICPEAVGDELLNMLRTPQFDSIKSEVNAFLEEQQAYIITLARKKVPRRLAHPDLLKDEIDELVQTTLIKLWLALEKRSITHPKSYIKFIVRTQAVDMVRQHKPLLPLPLDEEGEIYHGNAMLLSIEGMQDPEQEYERSEVGIDWAEDIVGDLLALPPRQRLAMLCSLKGHLEDNHPLLTILKRRGIALENIHWPSDKDELQRLQSSLSIARKKLRAMKDHYTRP